MSSEITEKSLSQNLEEPFVKEEGHSEEVLAGLAIRVSGLSKYYSIYDTPRDRLKQFVLPSIQRVLGKDVGRYFREFWALRDISFQVQTGETVGIVGRNGSGKSTLLQIIGGMLTPSDGCVEASGCIAAMLELGSGFNPEFTGRENVFLSAAVLGLSQEEIEERFPEIAAFADIGEFLDQPIKTYSSGMLMRLAFAVNTCVEPEILIVDEALSVGDVPFQAKCYKRLRSLMENGTSILLVSHDLETVRSLCHRALWLKNGRVEGWGNSKEIAKEYEKFCWEEQGVTIKEESGDSTPLPQEGTLSFNPSNLPNLWEETLQALSERDFLQPSSESSSQFGNKYLVIDSLSLTNSLGEVVSEFEHSERVTVHYKFRAQRAVSSECMIGIRIRNVKGDFLCSINDVEAIQKLNLIAGEIAYARMAFDLPLAAGDYIVHTAIFGFKDGIAFPPGGYDFNRAVLWDVQEEAMFIKVRPYKKMSLAGPVHLKAKLEFFQL